MDLIGNSWAAPPSSVGMFGGEIGVRGEVFIALDKDEFRAGELLSGSLTLVVSDVMTCNGTFFGRGLRTGRRASVAHRSQLCQWRWLGLTGVVCCALRPASSARF